MSQQDAFAEAVFFFEGDDISTEMHYREFEALLNQATTLENFAASQVRGAYVVVGTGLAVRGMVSFLLRIDEDGHADRNFSVPLRHLVRHAGPGPGAELRRHDGQRELASHCRAAHTGHRVGPGAHESESFSMGS